MERYRIIRLTALVALSVQFLPCAETAAHGYIGPEVCSTCHAEIAKLQAKSAMALTWKGAVSADLPSTFDLRISDEIPTKLSYELGRTKSGLTYSVTGAVSEDVHLPVDIVMGGTRHGLGFLARLNALDGVALERPALIQARYFWSVSKNQLVLAPGLPMHPARSYESELGLVLSPAFETRCLTCHGQPNTLGAGNTGGVRCESCHGPGGQHLLSVQKGASETHIVNPRKLSTEDSIAVCGQCHNGFGRHLDPAPEDLLIANQVTALKESECFLQSGGKLTCTACHNPHQNSILDKEASRNTCLSCHSANAMPHAAICPMNTVGDCVGCHMPSVDVGPLHLVDHWIRVHPEQLSNHGVIAPALPTETPPLKEYLRLIATADKSAIQNAKRDLDAGQSFYDVARRVSTDPSNAIGGYLGQKTLAQLETPSANAALHLRYGETSGVLQAGPRWVILQRLPRDFRWQADQILKRAMSSKLSGDLPGAMKEAQDALKVYPHFRRALVFLTTTLAETGAIERAAKVLMLTSEMYPEDAETVSDLALIQGSRGKQLDEIELYRRAINLEPDLVPAYLNLGNALAGQGDWPGAVEAYRHGLSINPLSAGLYANMAAALSHLGDVDGSKAAMRLATKIDPSLLR